MQKKNNVPLVLYKSELVTLGASHSRTILDGDLTPSLLPKESRIAQPRLCHCSFGRYSFQLPWHLIFAVIRERRSRPLLNQISPEGPTVRRRVSITAGRMAVARMADVFFPSSRCTSRESSPPVLALFLPFGDIFGGDFREEEPP